MPNVRASSGMMGTIRLPISGSRRSLENIRTKAIVVEACRPCVPFRNSSKTSSAGTASGLVLTCRLGR